MRVLLLALFAAVLDAQDPNAAAQKAVDLAMKGHCPEAFPELHRALIKPIDKELKRSAALVGVRCGMTFNSQDDTLDFIRFLNKTYPKDPEILYLTVHVFSDLSIRASQALLFTNPGSPQVHQLNAEAMETQGKWQEATSEYREVLAKNPNQQGIHYRLARLILSQAKAEGTNEEAKQELEAELKINPDNPGAEYILGEMARQAERWPEAIEHFKNSAMKDAGFADAWIGLGRSLLSAGKIEESIVPLERAEKLQPPNPVPHYYLAIAYRRVGRHADANREVAMHKQTSDQARQTKQELQLGLLGPQRVDAKEVPNP
jgi:predicted Zn-dependent protease